MSEAFADLLAGDGLTPATRRVLVARVAPVPPATLLDARLLATLDALCARLVPEAARFGVEVAARLHADIAAGIGDGWRYAVLRDDATALIEMLSWLADQQFAALDAAAQEAMLASMATPCDAPPARWLRDIATRAVCAHYADPRVQLAIGFKGMADAHGWQDVGAPA